MKLFRRHLMMGYALSLLLGVSAAQAQPNSIPAPGMDGREPIRLLVGFPPGSGVDRISRVFAEALAQRLSRPVTVENRTGARGNVAGEEVARATADGNTLGVVTATTMILNRNLSRQLGYDPQADLTPISRFASLPLLVLGGPGQGLRT
ncbi:Bug family tripartite tricarboxylate transporter substrate binding protein, partial [Roseococcus sp.]|uniref:Bug family tripartite tricarboxylate transporter substrate binding protein n=1 Tax=Roseococcus sp. TaxID=2109646 RepID=UPI003BA84421